MSKKGFWINSTDGVFQREVTLRHLWRPTFLKSWVNGAVTKEQIQAVRQICVGADPCGSAATVNNGLNASPHVKRYFRSAPLIRCYCCLCLLSFAAPCLLTSCHCWFGQLIESEYRCQCNRREMCCSSPCSLPSYIVAIFKTDLLNYRGFSMPHLNRNCVFRQGRASSECPSSLFPS